jgi:hypothetical protein
MNKKSYFKNAMDAAMGCNDEKKLDKIRRCCHPDRRSPMHIRGASGIHPF